MPGSAFPSAEGALMRVDGIGRVRSPGAGRVALLLAWLALAASAWPAPNRPTVPGPRPALVAAEDVPVVESVDIRGSRFVPKATLLYYVSTKPGDRYDET